MAVFIELQEDPFNQAFDETLATSKNQDLKVRRPMRGIQMRKDRPAYITIVDKFGKPIPIIDAGGEEKEGGKGYSERSTNFLVTGYSATRKERSQIIQTFGEDFTFFYGDQPRVYQIQGVLMHTADFNWRNEFIYNYENYLRGTKLVERKARAYISQSGLLWEGYAMQFGWQETAAQPNHVQFTLQFLVTNETIIDGVGDVSFPVINGDNGTGLLDQPWAYTVLLQQFELNRRTLPERTNFASELANYIQSGGAPEEQTFTRKKPLRGKISDNLDEYLGGGIIKADLDERALANAMQKMTIKRILYRVKEQYLRAKFVLDSTRRLARGEQSILARAFGFTFIITSLTQAALADQT